MSAVRQFRGSRRDYPRVAHRSERGQRQPAALPNRNWSTIYSAVVATVALVAAVVNALAYYYTNVYVHRNLFITITPSPEASSGGAGPATGPPFNLSPVIQNIGNYTEVIISIAYSIRYNPDPGSSGNNTFHREGPFVLKPGDAISVPISFPFDAVAWYARYLTSRTYRTSVSVSFLDPDEKLFWKDIPVAEIDLRGYFEQPDHSGAVNFTERVSPDYKDGPVNLISSSSWFRRF